MLEAFINAPQLVFVMVVSVIVGKCGLSFRLWQGHNTQAVAIDEAAVQSARHRDSGESEYPLADGRDQGDWEMHQEVVPIRNDVRHLGISIMAANAPLMIPARVNRAGIATTVAYGIFRARAGASGVHLPRWMARRRQGHSFPAYGCAA